MNGRNDGPAGFPYMAQVVPAGQAGDVVIEHQAITDGGGIHAVLHGYGTRNGTYAVLKIRGNVVMSDTDMERRSNVDIRLYGTGDVLIGGLGIGMVLCGLLPKPDVRSVTVIEHNPNVINLVQPAIRAWATRNGIPMKDRLTIILGNIWTWRPLLGVKFDTIYFDIWSDICTDNLAEIAKLHQLFKRFKRTRESFMDSWQSAELRAQRREDQRRGW